MSGKIILLLWLIFVLAINILLQIRYSRRFKHLKKKSKD